MIQSPSTGASRAGFHRVAEFMECPRKFAFSHVEQLEPPRLRPALAKGSLIHLGLAHHYGQMAGREWARDPVEVMREAPAEMSYVFEEARAIVEAYVKHYREEPFRVVDVEREF